MREIEKFFYNEGLVLAFLRQNERIEGQKVTKFRLVTDEFPPAAREEVWSKDAKGFSYQGSVTRPVDPKLVDKLIARGFIENDGEQRYKIRSSTSTQ